MDMQERDGIWSTSIEIAAPGQAELIKRVATIQRILRKLDGEKSKPRRARGEGALFKRGDGLWVGRVELDRGPDGMRRMSKPVYSKDRATAVAKLNKLKEDIAAGIEQTSDVRLTLAAYLDDWIDVVAKPRMKPHAWKSYRSAIKTRIAPAIGGRRLSTLSTDDVLYLHSWILGASYTRGGEEQYYSTRSVEEAHNVLSAALRDAGGKGLVRRNVCELVKKPKVLSEKHGALSAEDARKVLLAAMHGNDPMVTRWAAGLMLGGRQGELLGLEWDRVDLDKGVLDLAWQLEWLPLKPGAAADDADRFDVERAFEHRPLWRGAALTRPKTAKSQRVIPIPAPLAAILAVHRDRTPPNPWGLVWVSTPKARTRYGRDATPVSDRADREAWAAAQQLAKVDPVSVHGMRGTTATLLMEAGVDARIIQAILGHSDVVTTRGYQQVDLDAARRSLGNLHGLLELG